jgi:parallel beta-helix repeat protein
MMKKLLALLSALSLFLFSCKNNHEVELKSGMTLTESVTLRQDTFLLAGADSLDQPVLTIEGENITVDFNGAMLDGGQGRQWPDEFSGTAILIKGKNITLKNAVVRGFKVAIMAEGVDSLRLLDCDFSYNWRPRLKSIREREDFSDWLSYHQNDQDEWLRYGAAMYLKNCQHALVRGVTVTGGMNGLMLTGCNDGLFYNNTIHFNSGVGIGLYRSSRNRVMHNRLDWNVRGYSHGFYQRGQDSAAILVYEQSSENTFAYNSATHSGDGFFLWAGQSTMDTGEGGCNDNLLYRNDFSHAPTNGIEVTFSRNKIVANKMTECRYGIWGGYSYESLFLNNEIENCEIGIAIENGQHNRISHNQFRNGKVGIQIFAREKQPENWGYSKKKDVSSRNYSIIGNSFEGINFPLKISSTDTIGIYFRNIFEDFEKVLVEEKPNKGLLQNITYCPDMGDSIYWLKYNHIPPLPDGMNTALDSSQLKGRQYILVDEWGPYDFRSPAVWLRNIEGNKYTFLLTGPKTGNWRAIGGEGWSGINQKTGSFASTVVATKEEGAEFLSLEFEFIGEAFTDRFRNFNKKGRVYPFGFTRFEKKLDWQVRWYNYDEASDPLKNYEAFKNLKNQPPMRSEVQNDLYFAWWGSPGEGVKEDNFATFAETEFDIAEGTYRISLTSDDGAKLFLDGKLLIDHWDIHEPATDEIEVKLGGRHRIEIEHFEGGGFGTLDFRIAK